MKILNGEAYLYSYRCGCSAIVRVVKNADGADRWIKGKILVYNKSPKCDFSIQFPTGVTFNFERTRMKKLTTKQMHQHFVDLL